jgi:hypothetical protein
MSYSVPMSMTSFIFDRLPYIHRHRRRLRGTARARHAEALDAALRDGASTKGDLRELGQELRKEFAKLRFELKQAGIRLEAKVEITFASFKADILCWLIVTQLALGRFILAAIKSVN